MKSLLLTAILQLSVIMGFSQNWSDPIIVSNGGYSYQPDFTKDKFGTITLRDCFGRSVYNIYQGKTTPGNMKFYLNYLDLSSLRPAVYYFDFQLGNKRINRNVIYTPDKY